MLFLEKKRHTKKAHTHIPEKKLCGGCGAFFEFQADGASRSLTTAFGSPVQSDVQKAGAFVTDRCRKGLLSAFSLRHI